jgi:hypothetical protein
MPVRLGLGYAAEAKSSIAKATGSAPALYTGGEHDFERLCFRDDIDLEALERDYCQCEHRECAEELVVAAGV